MADDWAGLAAQLGKMQRGWYATQGSYWSVFDPSVDTATIIAEDGSTRQVPSWRAMANTLAGKADLAGGAISGQFLFYSSFNGGSLRQVGDIGSVFSGWRNAPSFVSMVCQNNTAAYMLWKADSLARPLASCMVHARNADTASATVQYRVANSSGPADGDAVFELLGDGSFSVFSPSGPWNVILSREGHVRARGLIQPGSFTKSTLPPANSMPGGFAFITDGPNGSTHVFSNGAKWRIPTMTDL